MPTYVTLLEYTQQGIENVEESPDRLDKARALAESMGVEIIDWYLTFGQYDAVAVITAPDDETFAQFALAVGKGGAISSETLKAFPEDEYRELMAGIPS